MEREPSEKEIQELQDNDFFIELLSEYTKNLVNLNHCKIQLIKNKNDIKSARENVSSKTSDSVKINVVDS